MTFDLKHTLFHTAILWLSICTNAQSPAVNRVCCHRALFGGRKLSQIKNECFLTFHCQKKTGHCQLKVCGVLDCSVPCKMSWDELEAMCRMEKLQCQELGVSRANVNEYEVEFLCDYKKTKV